MRRIILLIALVVGLTIAFRDELAYFVYKKGHHGLINYDYGIISMRDFNQSDKDSFPAVPFNSQRVGYPYWQCFNKKYLKIACRHNEPIDKPGSSLSIDIETEVEIHSYGLNHAISGEVCNELVAEINYILNEQTYFCINGIDGTLDRLSEKREYSWSFYRMKTKNGYANYRLN